MPLKVLTRSYRGEEKISTVPIEIPANATGELSILVTDGRQLNAMEQRELRRSLQPQTVTQLMRRRSTRRAATTAIYVRLLTGTPGAVVKGEAMTALPPSVLSVLESDRNGGSFTPIRSATVGEWELPMDSAVTGSRLLTIEVDGAARAADAVRFLLTFSPSHICRAMVPATLGAASCVAGRWRDGQACRAATPTFWTVARRAIS